MKYEVRALSLGGILDQTISLTKDHFGALFQIVAVTLLPLKLLQAAIELTVIPPLPAELNLETLETWTTARNQAMAENYPLIMGSTLLAILVIPVSNAALIHTIAKSYLGRMTTFGEALGLAFRSVGKLYWTWILVVAAIVGGLICLIIPGILAAFWFSLATQVVVIEGIGGFGALKRSRALMKGNIGRIFAMALVLGAIGFGMQIAVGLIPQAFLQTLIFVLIQCVLLIVNSAALVIFYFSARCQHEQFDLQLLAENLNVKNPDDVLADR